MNPEMNAMCGAKTASIAPKETTEFETLIEGFAEVLSELDELNNSIGYKSRRLKNLSVPQKVSESGVLPSPDGIVETLFHILYRLRGIKQDFYETNNQLNRIV